MVMADGSMIECSKDVEKELFSAIPFSYGTLGFLTGETYVTLYHVARTIQWYEKI